MMLLSLLLAYFVFILRHEVLVVNGNDTKDLCLQNGFVVDKLLCDSCDKLSNLLDMSNDNNINLVEQCQMCCKSEENESVYSKAILELDKRYLKMMPDIQRIIDEQKTRKKEKKMRKNEVVISFRLGARPTLYLFKNEDDEMYAESISIAQWTFDAFEEYLASSLNNS